MKGIRKMISLWLALCLVISMVPVQTFAQEETVAETAVTETDVAAAETTLPTESAEETTEETTDTEEPTVPETETLTVTDEAMGISIIASGEYGGTKEQPVTWSLDSTGTLTISGVGGMTSNNYVTPWNSYVSQIKTVIVNYGVTSLGNGAFRHCENLTSVSLPNSLITIGKMAFGECKSLKELVIPDSVVSIGSRLVDSCDSLEKLHLSSGLTEICDELIYVAPKLKDLNIPSGVTKIGDYSIYLCDSLTNIVLPEGLKTIGERAFEGAHNLKEINFPESLEVIGEKAFYSCGNLEYVSIPANVKSIGKNAFSSGWPNSYGRVAHYVSEDNPYYSSDSHGVLFDKNKTVLIQVPLLLDGSYEIPNTVQTIEPEAFRYCINIDKIVIPNSVSSIGKYAFWNCKSLTSISIPGSVASIPEYAFSSCMLEEINLSEGLVEIGEGAFWGQAYHSEVGTLTIPSTVRKIGVDAFVGTWFESVIFEGDAPEVTKLYDYDYGTPPFQSNAIYYYHGDNSTWTEEAKIALSGEDLIKRWEPLGNMIKVEIPETDVATNRMVCGTVLPTDNNIMTPNLVLNPEAVFTQVSVKLSLPEGFSFAENQIKKENVLNYEELSEVKIESLKIYPIYIDSSVQKEEYCITITVNAMDSSGEWMTRTEKEVFYRPSYISNGATSSCSFSHDPYSYSLDTLYGSGTTYNQETARLCAMLSDMAYHDQVLESFLTSGMGMGFSDLETRGFPDNGSHLNEIGRHYAYKRIIVDGEIKNVVYIICRGTVGAKEWTSNLIVGLGSLHHGFRTAADDIKEEIRLYCSERKFTQDNTIFLVTGHSRGAAVANLVGHWLNTEANLAYKENISVYTFATPTVDKSVINEVDGCVGNENIFNFVNYQDPIRNAPSMQYYGRYGSTTVFAYETAEAGEEYHDDGYLTYSLPSNGNYTIPEIVNGILFANNPGTMTGVSEILASVGALFDMWKYYYGADAKRDEIAQAHGMAYYYQAVVNNASDATFTSINQRTRAANEFFYDMWRDFEQFKNENPLWYIILKFCCPINLYIYDTGNNLVASIVDKEISCNDENLILFVDGDSLNVGCVKDKLKNYTIQVVGYDEGTMNHCIQTIGIDGMESIMVRKEIPIEKNGILELNENGYVLLPGEDENQAQSKYSVYKDKEKIEDILSNLDHDHVYTDERDPTCDICGEEREIPIASVPMYRMYDPNSGEHFYTGSTEERDFLVNAGWSYEGVGFNFPEEGAPVYRLYEPVYGEHLYTMDKAEKEKLLSWGWNDEGVAFNSAGEDEVPQYRLHNPNAKRGGYHFTGSIEERDFLISIGWINEGIGWYSCLE